MSSTKPKKSKEMSRRSFFVNTGAATAAVAALGGFATIDDYEAVAGNVNTNSQPSNLQITDMRVCGNYIRLDTNQGISGYGEVRDQGSVTYALMLKSRILGENPCNVDKIWRKLKQFGYHGRQAGGPVSIEMACWDLAGKAWAVPCWQMLGGKFRDRILMYADTPGRGDPVQTGNSMKRRLEKGYKFLKMDFGIEMLRGIKDTITAPGTIDPFQQWSTTVHGTTEHPFTGIRLTEKGLDVIEDFCRQVRETIGWEIPIATDHYGHMILEDQIKMAQRLDKFNFAWYEDMVPWWYTDMYIKLKNSCSTPILTGEDIYCLEGFRDLIDNHAVSMIHPDLATSGGLLETKKIGDYAQDHGIAMAMHMAGNVVTWYASIHCAAATENFLVMEHHGADNPRYDNPVTNIEKPLFKEDGFVYVPNGPGLGIVLDEEQMMPMGMGMMRRGRGGRSAPTFETPTDEWNNESSHDRLWSMHIKEKKQIPLNIT
jgi:L-alanine-DL-glutamate epimerase-like enolase superfamily enzyme